MTSAEFIAKIKLVLEGSGQVTQGVQTVSKEIDKLSEKQVQFPWTEKMNKSLEQGKGAVTDFAKELDGFTKVGQKVNTIYEGGNAVGARAVQIYKNQSGAIKEISTNFDKNGTVIKQGLTDISKGATGAAGMMEQFGLAMRRALIVAPVWMLMRAGMMAVFNTIRDQVKFLISLEEAMTRIKIVGKGTAEEYTYLQNSLVSLAHAYGVTSDEAAKAAVIFAQQGKTVKETITLTQTAMLAAQVLGTDVKGAVETLTAAMQGFRISASEATSIVDKWINVEKQFAVTSNDLAEATKVSGAAANQLGLSISEFLGDVTAVVEVTRKSGSEAARALSFVYARLLTNGKEVLEQVAKIPFYLDETGKASNVVSTNMRSISDVLGELAGKWDKLNTAEKLQIATSLGSKRQMTGLYALMQNYNHSLDARIASLTSAGQAEKAFGLIQEQTSFKIKQVSSAWNVLTTALGDTSGFKASLGLLDRMIINFTALINYEKAYGALYAKEVTKQKLAVETRYNEINSLEELIKLRENLSKAPETAENINRLKTVTDVIDNIVKKEPKIKVALETGKPEELKQTIDNITKVLTLEKIKLDVSLEFEPKIAAGEEKIRELKHELQLTGGRDVIKLKVELGTEEVKVQELYKAQTDEIENQYKALLGRKELEKGFVDILSEEEPLSAELTEAERERLDIEKQIIMNRGIFLDNEELQIQKERELVQNSKYLYDIHEKRLKLEEINNKLVDARVKKQEQEKNNVKNLYLEYEKADMFERQKVRRKIEIQTMSPEGIESAFRGANKLDRNLILDMFSSFVPEIQTALARMIGNQYNLPGGGLFAQPSAPTYGGQFITPGAPVPITQISNVGAKTVIVQIETPTTTPEEMASLVGDKVKEGMLEDDDFQKAFSKRISPKL